MTISVLIRRLDKSDDLIYRQIRLQALQTNPEAFLSTFDYEQLKDQGSFAYELSLSQQPPVWGYYGLFINDKLIGFCQISKSYLIKQQHIAFLYNLYLTPDYRGQGYAKKLVRFVLEKVKTLHIERVFISYLAKNTRARGFYDYLGFKQCGLKPQAAKDGSQYDDEIEMVLEL
ncbi:GNAT family N-acetyltransferase [Patescibacteria group bacterium]|nr:GNAT family N-acetyltransferase [Patescibacteria group bacterium]MBU1967482.1 GNAT family N-acetyltransferase [Patescibacteria group bacterium]MBU2542975.1 GNAT family N-acetyltransferase [Patescibacteria group bacterium]